MSSEPSISSVALGCWPIAGVTTLNTNEADSLATIRACRDLGVNHLDTAYVYGPHGESEKMIAKAVKGWREELIIATKCGIHFEGDSMVNCARPETIRREVDQSLRRLETEKVEILYLHAIDPATPLEESAGTLSEIVKAGKADAIGVCNANVEQLEAFQSVCPISVVQLPFNMLQRDVERRIIPWCHEREIAVTVYWVLMKGLLAGKLARQEELAPDDSRRNYPMYQGREWEKNQDFIDKLRMIADELECSVAQLVVGWTIRQAGITSALCGAKRPDQIRDTSGAMNLDLSAANIATINQAIEIRGPAEGKRLIS